jgi:ABC transporter DrrB family efflux protein
MILRGLAGIIYKELIQLSRDPATLVITLLIPVVQLTIFGYAIDTEVKNVKTAILDQDKTVESRDFINRLEATGLYRIVDYVDSEEELYDTIVASQAKTGVRIPAGYARRLNGGKPATIQVLIDGSDNSVAGQTVATVQNLGLNISAEIMTRVRGGTLALPLEVRTRLLFNPSLRSSNFFVPGIIGILLFLVTMMLTAFAIVREREVGTLEQLMVTPVSKSALMLGKVLPYAALGMIQMLVVILFARLVFGVHIAGSLYLLLGLAFVFIFSSLGLGLIISTIARNQLQAMMASFMLMLPSILLSGFMFPRESMPLPIYWVSACLPVTYFIAILRGIVLRGAGMDALWDEALVLACMGVGLIAIAAWRFRKSVG